MPLALPVYNLGNPDEYTVLQVAQTISSMADVPLNVEHLELPKDDPMKRRPVTDRALECLGWRPEVDIRTGLSFTISDFRRRLEL